MDLLSELQDAASIAEQNQMSQAMMMPDPGLVAPDTGLSIPNVELGMPNIGAPAQSMQQQMFYQQLQSMYAPSRYDSYGTPIYPRFSKQQILDYLRQYILVTSGISVQRERKVEDLPDDGLRHCCVASKISKLQPCVFTAVSEGCPFNITFYFCTSCGTLFYSPDFM